MIQQDIDNLDNLDDLLRSLTSDDIGDVVDDMEAFDALSLLADDDMMETADDAYKKVDSILNDTNSPPPKNKMVLDSKMAVYCNGCRISSFSSTDYVCGVCGSLIYTKPTNIRV